MQDIYSSFEFYKIQEKLHEYAKTEVGNQNIDSLKMFNNQDELVKSLVELKEIISALTRFGPMPISNSADALYLISLAKKTGLLTPRDLHLIAEDVFTSFSISKYLNKLDTSYVSLKERASKFFDLTPLEKEIHRVINSALTINDNATVELKEIRNKLRKAERQLEQKVASLSLTYSAYLNDENATIRDGHFVLPVKTSDKSKVLGIVYDVSSSGNTTFIEPMEVVQLNNLLTSLKVEENEEIRKILKQLTALVLMQEEEIITNNKIIGHFDFLVAKGMYAIENNDEIGEISKESKIELFDARHPLIDKNKVISNTYYFDEKKRIVIISGPNAGGKTVSLKTVGLCLMMHQCGLAVPCKRATFSFFNHIYIDIGDNQSLSDNLSTFSAHISQIAEIVNLVKGKDLILLDELGTGTDPKEGEALALSTIKYLESKKCLAMISSHFDALKEYAFLSENIENSSMAFDEENLLPTYRFRLGTPGHSYALSVASRYGIKNEIIEDAKKYLNEKKSNDASTLISILEKKIEEVHQLQEETKRTNLEISRREKKLENDEKILLERRENLLKDVKEEKERLIEKAKKEVDEIISLLSKGDLKLHEVIELKKKVDDLKEKEEEILYNEEIEIGDYVSLPSLNINGKVLRINKGKVHIVSDDGLSYDVKKENLHKIIRPVDKGKHRQSKDYDSLIKYDVSLQLNIIGLRVDEAKDALEKYLDDCRMKNFETVRIIHGFGSGALRKMTHEYLSKQKDLTYRLGQANEGAGGATVITFKK